MEVASRKIRLQMGMICDILTWEQKGRCQWRKQLGFCDEEVKLEVPVYFHAEWGWVVDLANRLHWIHSLPTKHKTQQATG